LSPNLASAHSAGPRRLVINVPGRSYARARNLGFIALAAVAALATAILTVRSPQLGASAALVGLVVTAYVGHRPTGLAALWALWLLAPGLRRVLGLETGYVGADPLAVAPFAATGLVAALALLQFRLSRQATLVLVAGGVGLLLGLPAGIANPSAAAFAGVAYASALGALVIGWSEGGRPLRRWSLSRALAVGAPVLALYALFQYFVALPAWDDAWLEQVDFVSVGSPEEGRVRVFSTLNAPAVLAIVLSLGLLLGLVRRRVGPVSLALMTLVTVALAVTYFRSAWLALVVGILVLLMITRGRAMPQLLALVAVLAVAGLALSLSQGTLDAFVGRVSTFGSLDTDVSAEARGETAQALAPRILVAPLGYGLGSTGEATRLAGGDEGLPVVDNGYLSLAYQVGIPGALLVLAGLFVATWTSARSALRADPDRNAATLTAVFAFFIVLLLSGDQLYGLPGAILWYLVGAALARQAADGVEPAATPRRLSFARGGPSPPYSPPGDSQRHPGVPGSHHTSR